MNLASLASGLINPKILFSILARILKESANHEVEQFDMNYFGNTKLVDFTVWAPSNIPLPEHYKEDRTRPYKLDDGATLTNTIIKYLAKYDKELQGNGTLDFAVLHYRNDGKNVDVDLYFTTDQNEKQKINYILVP